MELQPGSRGLARHLKERVALRNLRRMTAIPENIVTVNHTPTFQLERSRKNRLWGEMSGCEVLRSQPGC